MLDFFNLKLNYLDLKLNLIFLLCNSLFSRKLKFKRNFEVLYYYVSQISVCKPKHYVKYLCDKVPLFQGYLRPGLLNTCQTSPNWLQPDYQQPTTNKRTRKCLQLEDGAEQIPLNKLK